MSDVLKWRRAWHHPAKAPFKATDGSAGYDLTWTPRENREGIIHPGAAWKLETGWKAELPEGCYGKILDRSSIAIRGLLVIGGVLDADYRDEIIVILRNIGNDAARIEPLERIAQLIVQPIFTGDSVEVESLDDTERKGGFGHTGRF